MSASLLGSAFEFCKKYNIHDAIANWLSDIYEPVGERYRLIGADSGAGVQIYDEGRHCYSHHAKDAAGGIVCNSFDLVRIHKFGHLDASPKVASPDMESYKAMEAWIVDNALCPVVKQALDLKYDANNKPQSTSDNMIKVLKGDPELNEGGDTFYYDMFRDNIMVCGDLPWKPLVDRGLSAGWSDVDDAGIRNFFEWKYGMVDRGKTLDALMLTAEERRVHPIRDYLHAVPWDGIPRADTLLIDYLQADDTPYTRTVTRKALLGAVARVMQPGCKHDHVLVLVGPQGCGKSTLINKLGGKYFTDSLSTMQGKEACELLQGYWIVELSEMTAVRKSEMDQIKQFISKTTDNYRAAYARTTKDRPRQCAFIGSTNEEEFLRDPTGNRRFWPVGVSQSDITKLDALTEDVIQQIWAEILIAYKAGEKWHLNPEEEKDAKEQQDSRRVVDPKQGQLELWLESDVPEGWNNTPASERMMWYSAPQKTGIKRRAVSAAEVWREHYGMRDADLSRVKAMEINDMLARLPGWRRARITSEAYGQQRGFIRE
jgi:predicted P-loop ATPase